MRKKSYILSVIAMRKSFVKRNLGAGAAVLLCAAALVFSRQARDGAARGVELCLRVLVPSLFPFMALSSLTVKTGACAKAGKALGGVTQRLFGLSGAFAPVLLLGLTGGYPVGAKGIGDLYRAGRVSENEAKRAALFTVCAGPGFLVNFAGLSVFGSQTLGWILLGAQVTSALFLGAAIHVLTRKQTAEEVKPKGRSALPLPFGDALVAAVHDGCVSMAGICGLVVLFSAFLGMAQAVIHSERAVFLLGCLMEVTTAVSAPAEGFGAEAVAFAAGFGGLCVHFQIFAALGNLRVNKLLFFFVRIIQGALTAALTKLGMLLFLRETAVFSAGAPARAGVFGGSVLSAAFLLAVTVGFLITFRYGD